MKNKVIFLRDGEILSAIGKYLSLLDLFLGFPTPPVASLFCVSW